MLVIRDIELSGGVAQLVRAPACHAGGREFEPRHSRHLKSRHKDGFKCFKSKVRKNLNHKPPCSLLNKEVYVLMIDSFSVIFVPVDNNHNYCDNKRKQHQQCSDYSQKASDIINNIIGGRGYRQDNCPVDSAKQTA